MSDAAKFQNALRIMNSLDEINTVISDYNLVRAFHNDPYKVASAMHPKIWAKVYALIEARQPKPRHHGGLISFTHYIELLAGPLHLYDEDAEYSIVDPVYASDEPQLGDNTRAIFTQVDICGTPYSRPELVALFGEREVAGQEKAALEIWVEIHGHAPE